MIPRHTPHGKLSMRRGCCGLIQAQRARHATAYKSSTVVAEKPTTRAAKPKKRNLSFIPSFSQSPTSFLSTFVKPKTFLTFLRKSRDGKANKRSSSAWTALSEFQPSSDRQKGVLLLNLLVLICGLNWVVLKQSESVLDPGLFCIFRFGLAALAFWPYFKKVDEEICWAGLEIGAWAAVGYLAQAQGLLTTEASRASFISTLTVLVVPILAGLSGKGVKALTWASAVAAFCGVGLLEDGFSIPSIGDLWQLLSAFAFGVQLFRTEHHSSKLSSSSVLPLMSVVVATIAAASIALTTAEHVPETLAWLSHPGQLLQSLHMPTWQQILPVVWSALMSTDLVLLIEVLALHDVSSTDASIIYTAEPVLGAAFAYVLLGERWGPLGWAGAGLIVASSLITQLDSAKQEEQEDQHQEPR